jgi:hypothetical protein
MCLWAGPKRKQRRSMNDLLKLVIVGILVVIKLIVTGICLAIGFKLGYLIVGEAEKRMSKSTVTPTVV